MLEEQWNCWRLRSQICYDSIHVKNDGQLKTIKRIELPSTLTTTLFHIEIETGTKEVYKCPSESPNYYYLRKLLSSDIYIPSDIRVERSVATRSTGCPRLDGVKVGNSNSMSVRTGKEASVSICWNSKQSKTIEVLELFWKGDNGSVAVLIAGKRCYSFFRILFHLVRTIYDTWRNLHILNCS